MGEKAPGGHSGGMQSEAPIKIFLADDSALIRTRVAAMLAGPPVSVVGQAASAAAAVEGILAARPDVVVTDVQLAGGSGLDVIRLVREVVPGIAFIVFSSHSEAEYRKRYLGAGASRFLDKSTEFDQLPGAVRQAVH